MINRCKCTVDLYLTLAARPSSLLLQFLLHFFHVIYLSAAILYTTCRGRYPDRKTPSPVTKDIPKVILTYNYSFTKRFGAESTAFFRPTKKRPLILWIEAFSSLNMGLYGPAFFVCKKNVNNSLERCGIGIYCEIDVLSDRFVQMFDNNGWKIVIVLQIYVSIVNVSG